MPRLGFGQSSNAAEAGNGGVASRFAPPGRVLYSAFTSSSSPFTGSRLLQSPIASFGHGRQNRPTQSASPSVSVWVRRLSIFLADLGAGMDAGPPSPRGNPPVQFLPGGAASDWVRWEARKRHTRARQDSWQGAQSPRPSQAKRLFQPRTLSARHACSERYRRSPWRGRVRTLFPGEPLPICPPRGRRSGRCLSIRSSTDKLPDASQPLHSIPTTAPATPSTWARQAVVSGKA